MSKATQRTAVTERIAHHLLTGGLSRTSLRQLADAAEVSDRMLIYYFSDKAGVLSAAIGRLADNLAALLAAGIPDDERLAPRDLLLRAASVTQSPAIRPFMRLWVEVVAAAARGEAPYPAVSGAVADSFTDWVDRRLTADVRAGRPGICAAIVAAIDGIALIEICSGKAASDSAADALSSLFPS